MRILVLQFRRIGDVLMTTPMLRAIGRLQPDAVVDYCVEPASQPVVRSNPYVSETIVAPNGPSIGLVPGLRRRAYDVVLDTLGSPHTARLAFLSGAPVRIGLARRWRSLFYTSAVPRSPVPRYSALDKLALLEPLGLCDTDCRIELFPSDEERGEAERFWSALPLPPGRRVVGFSPVSRRRMKRWPADRFADLCDRWAEEAGLTYLPLYGPAEAAQVEAVVSRARRREAFLWPCPVVSFGALMPVLARCSLYVGCDNAIRHVAIAAGTPTAAVFGPPDPRSWTPPGSTQDDHVGGGAAAAAVTARQADRMMAQVLARQHVDTGGRA